MSIAGRARFLLISLSRNENFAGSRRAVQTITERANDRANERTYASAVTHSSDTTTVNISSFIQPQTHRSVQHEFFKAMEVEKR